MAGVAKDSGACKPAAAIRTCRDILARLEDMGVPGRRARDIYEQAAGCADRLEDLLARHISEPGDAAVKRACGDTAVPCVVCLDVLEPTPPGDGANVPSGMAPPAVVQFDCGHRVCFECATGMIRAKRDDAADAVNLLDCPCERLEGCGGALFLAETERVLALLEAVAAQGSARATATGNESVVQAAPPRDPAQEGAKGPGGGVEMEVDTGTELLHSAIQLLQCLCALLSNVSWRACAYLWCVPLLLSLLPSLPLFPPLSPALSRRGGVPLAHPLAELVSGHASWRRYGRPKSPRRGSAPPAVGDAPHRPRSPARSGGRA
jgi:hypothetical protein